MKYKLTFNVTDTDEWVNRNMTSDALKYDRAVQVGTELAKALNQSKKESHLEFSFADTDVEE